MPEKTTNLNLPIPLGNENVNRQYFVDLIQAIDSGAVSEEQLSKAIGAIKIELVDAFDSTDKQKASSADALRRGLETKQNTLRLADNYLAASVLINAAAADNGGKEYPNGVSMFKVSTSTAGWPAANGYVLTFRVGGGGYQVFYESYGGTVQTDKTARQWTRSKRDSNGFWQEWSRSATEVDINIHSIDHIKHPLYAANPTGNGALYTISSGESITTIPDGFGLVLVPNVANTGAANVKIDSATVVALKNVGGGEFFAGDLLAGQPYQFRKVGANFIKSSGGGLYAGLEMPTDRSFSPGAIATKQIPLGPQSINQGNGGVHVDSTRDCVFIVGYSTWAIYKNSTGTLLYSGSLASAIRYSAYDWVNGWVFIDPTGYNGWPYRINIQTGEVNQGFAQATIAGSVSQITPTYDGGYLAYSSFNALIYRFNSSGSLVWSMGAGGASALEYDKASDTFWTVLGSDSSNPVLTRIHATTRAVLYSVTLKDSTAQIGYRVSNIAYSKATNRLYVSLGAYGSNSGNIPAVWCVDAISGTFITGAYYCLYGQVDDGGNVYVYYSTSYNPNVIIKFNYNLAEIYRIYHTFLYPRSGVAISRNSKFPGSPDFYVQGSSSSSSQSTDRVLGFTQTIKFKA